MNLGVILGAWSVYNAIHQTRQNSVANLAVTIRKDFFVLNFYYLYQFQIAAVLGMVMLFRFMIGGKVFPALVVAGLSAVQVYRNYPYLK